MCDTFFYFFLLEDHKSQTTLLKIYRQTRLLRESQLEGRVSQYWPLDGAVQIVRYCWTGTAILPLDGGALQIARARGKTQSFIGRFSY
jgi:hypothetical protein